MISSAIQLDFTTDPVYTIIAVDPVRRLCLVTSTQNTKEWLPYATGSGFKGEGDFSLPPSGMFWKAIVEERRGQKEIVKVISPGSFFADDEQALNSLESDGSKQDVWNSITGTTASFRSYRAPSDNVRKNFRSNRFYDAIGGDWGYRGLEGNYVGVLRGGVSVLAASPLCGMYLFAEDDLARIVSRNFEVFTDFGIISVTNPDGKPRLAIKGVSGHNTKTSVREENYEFELEMGNCKNIQPDVFNLTLLMKTSAGEPFRLGIKRDGSVFLNTPGDVMTDIGGMYGNAVGDRYSVFAGKEARLQVGDNSLVVTKGKVAGGKELNVKSVVQAPHLDKYNDALKHITASLIPMIMYGAPPNEVFAIIQQLDLLNKTKDSFFS